MAWLNNSDFAKRVGVNEGNIRRAIKAGRIIVDPVTGLIDEESQVERYKLTRDTKRVHSGEPRNKPGRPKTATTADAQADALNVFQTAAEQDAKEQALRIDLLAERLKRERKENVSREETLRALSAFSRLTRDKWVNFANRYGQQLAAALGVDPKLAMAELDKLVRLQLDEIANARATLPE